MAPMEKTRPLQRVDRTAEGVSKPEVDSIFNAMFAEPHTELVRQRETMRTSSLGKDPSQTGLKNQAQNV